MLEGSNLSSPANDEEVVLYSHTMCPFAQRTWLALLEKGAPYTLVHVDLSNKPRFYKQVNPRGLVPCLAYQGDVITESEDICRCAPDTLSLQLAVYRHHMMWLCAQQRHCSLSDFSERQ